MWVPRPKREKFLTLSELKVGQRFEGTVITVREHGCYVDFGAKRDGFVRVRVSEGGGEAGRAAMRRSSGADHSTTV